MLIKVTINIFMNFHTNFFLKYFDRNFDKQPIPKKNNREANEAPKPKQYFSVIKKFFEKFPRKKTVSE